MADQNQAESSASKLKLKLKISKKINQEPISKTLQINEPMKTHACKECNRSFSSGKALGGHMSSAHVQAQANKDLSLKKLKSNSKKPNLGVRCKICGRYFHSNKSLFGHMKSHPDRHWRGMDPPQEDEKSEEDSLDYDEDDLSSFSMQNEDNESEQEENRVGYVGPVTDLSVSLKGWGTTGKRGRVEPEPEPEEVQDRLHAVYQLLGILNSPVVKEIEVVAENRTSGSGLGPEKRVVGENDEPMEKSMSISLDDGVEIRRNAKRAKVDKSISGSDEKLESPTIQEKASDTSVSPTPTSTPSKGVYTCSSCDKSFPTFQALGGHRSSHTKPRVSISNTIDEVDTYKSGSNSKTKNTKARGYSKLFGTGKGVPNKGTSLINMVRSSDQATTGYGSTQVNAVEGVPDHFQADLGFGSTQANSVDMAPHGSQATFENGSTQGSDRVSSSEQAATSADVRPQEPRQKVFLDLNQFPVEDEI